MQEKFQVGFEVPNEEAPDYWINPREARVKKNTPGRTGRSGGDYESRYMDNAMFLNSLPPGTDVEDQELTDQRKMRIIGSGTDDVTTRMDAGAFRRGFVDVDLEPTDDQYTREHNDMFYEDITVDGKTGFVERGNYLDRE